MRRMRTWTYAEAGSSIVYVRRLLVASREHYVAAWHYYRLNRRDLESEEHRDEMQHHREEGIQALMELERLGVLAYQNPLRGIALFPFLVRDDQGGTPREAWFVYKDSRPTIDSFVFNEELCFFADLYGYERPVPEEWKAGAVSKLGQEANSEEAAEL